MKNRINQLLEEVNQLIASNQDELEALRIKYLSKKAKCRHFSTILEMLLTRRNEKLVKC